MEKRLAAAVLLSLYTTAAAAAGVAAAAAAAAPSADTPAEIPFFPGREFIRVCTSEYTPIVLCNDRDPSDYRGYEIAVFNQVRKQLGWSDAVLNWSCLPWDVMRDSVLEGDSLCDITVAGLSIISDYLTAVFTLPTFSSGYKIMINSDEGTNDYFAWGKSFTWDLWLAILLTCIAVGVLLWGVDQYTTTLGSGGHRPPSLKRRIWATLGRPMLTEDLTSHSTAGSLIMLAFSFMTLILVTLLTANAAANLTATRIASTIRGVKDLPGKTIGTYEGYAEDFRSRGANVVPFPWNSEEDEEQMWEALRTQAVQAIILDSTLIDYKAATSCEFTALPGEWDSVYQGPAFPHGFNNTALLAEYNRILTEMKEMGQLEQIFRDEVMPEGACKSQSVSEVSDQISFQQVAGLWIMLALACCAALAILVVQRAVWHGARRASRARVVQASMRRLRSSLSSSGSRMSWLRGMRTHSRGSSAAAQSAARSMSGKSELDGFEGLPVANAAAPPLAPAPPGVQPAAGGALLVGARPALPESLALNAGAELTPEAAAAALRAVALRLELWQPPSQP